MERHAAMELELLRNLLDGVTDVLSTTMTRTSRSPLVRTAWDFSTAILSPEGELISQGLSQPLHLAGMMPALRGCLTRFKDKVFQGDIFMNNDPYEGGSHLPDIYFFKPVFVDNELLVYLATMAHFQDMGGRTPGSMAPDNSEIFQEGLRIPPTKLVDKGERNMTLFNIVEKAVRTPELVLGDLQAQISCLDLGEMEFRRSVGKIGREEFGQGVIDLLDYTERLTRAAIREFPDGSWSFTDSLDNDGITENPIYIKCNLTIDGEEIYVDFDGTSPQTRGAIQGMFTTNVGMVYIVVKSLVGPEVPNTSGLLRPIHIKAPEGSFVNPQFPAAVAGRSLGCRVINHAVWGAFAQAIPDKVFGCPGGAFCYVTISGYDNNAVTSKPWAILETSMEIAMGGRNGKDGIDAQCTNVTQYANFPAEVLELEFPITIEEYALLPDSEGPGEYRGGLGLRRTWQAKSGDTLFESSADRSKQPPWGVAGGQSSVSPHLVVNPKTANEEKPLKGRFLVDQGEVVQLDVCGAGGYGDPLERDPEKVLRDVIEQKVSLHRARDVYGVVIDTQKRRVDQAATKKLRSSKGSPGTPSETEASLTSHLQLSARTP